MEELKLASVKFKNTGKLYCFSTNLDLNINDVVILETARGVESGVIMKELESLDNFKLNSELKKITRKATRNDLKQLDDNEALAKEAFIKCKQIIKDMDLDMKLTYCQYTLDRKKLIIMYTSEHRVDFRDLLKELAYQFKCRIELKQIGPRDKARINGGIGTCGLPLCCSNMLGEFNGVSFNMAKNQMLAINIDKISGACGRLMCCLKYEDDIYTEKKKKYPKIGSFVKYEGNRVKIIGYNVVNDTVKIVTEDSIKFVPLDSIKIIKEKKAKENNDKQHKGKKARKPGSSK